MKRPSIPARAPAPGILRGRVLSRRAALRGAGVALALPWLGAMAPVATLRLRGQGGALRAPKRFAALFCPNGMLPSAWRPKGTGTEFELSPTLLPLATVRDQVAILGNLRNYEARVGEGHYVKTTSWLSGAPVKRTGGKDLQVGVSIDQYLSQRIGGATPLSSLVLGIEPVRNRVDMGYSTVYGANISWRTPSVPAAREISPRRALERLMHWTSPKGAVPGARGKKRILDLVHREARALQGSLGPSDAEKLSEYLYSVDALERRVLAMEAREAELRGPDLDPSSAASAETYEERVDLMLEIMVQAFRGDVTRVATFMFGNSVSGQNFSFLEGVEGGHHPLSHHEDKEHKKRQYALINRWHVGKFGAFLKRLGETHESEGTLGRSCAVLFGSGIADGNRHNPKDLPILLGGGVFKGGVHLRQPMLTPLCNLYTSVAKAFDTLPESDAAPFGDGTGDLAGLRRA